MADAAIQNSSDTASQQKAKKAKSAAFEILEKSNGVSHLMVRCHATRQAMSEANLLHPAYVWNEDEPPKAAQQERMIRQSAMPVPEFLSRVERNRDEIADAAQGCPSLRELIDAIERHRKGLFDLAEEKIKDGQVPVELALFFVRQGQRILVEVEGEAQAGEVVSVSLNDRLGASFLSLQYRYVEHNGSGFCKAHATCTVLVPPRGYLALASLPFRFLRDADIPALKARGEKFCEFAEKPSHIAYDGHMLVPGFFGSALLLAEGRCVIDLRAMQRCAPEIVSFHGEVEGGGCFGDDDEEDEAEEGSRRPSVDDLALCSPFAQGYSLRAKQWGRFAVSKLRQIAFRDDAFDKLAIDPERKTLIQALVAPREDEVSDIVDGKGGGCIFLLHGEPGVGKTLTAEAIAETLRKPLLMAGAGELGAEPETLEKRLKEILEIARAWDAVLLIDEADVFLESRSSGDVARNALVSIFLRLLEYYDGVLFLTTNRARQLDPAFLSRVAVGLHYRSLEEESRLKIWKGLLSASGRFKHLTDEDARALATLEINGRQIKNCLRQASAMAAFEKRAPQRADIEKMALINAQFLAKLQGV